ncbi:MAG: ABC transporter substrate-binding protein [Proteobacteria bacterium]|nr:ABC transporter substrate-binding protein [Pseudomonadota bacterium]
MAIVTRGGLAGRRQIIASLAVLMFSFSAASVPANANDTEASKFILSLGESALRVLRDKENTTFSEREFAFRQILVEGFHINTISRFVLGRHWRSATPAQRIDYTDVFVDFIVRVYASRFDSYNGEQFEIKETIASDAEGDTVVRTQILRPLGAAPIGVDFRVRVIEGSYRVVDVTVEGISMLHTHRVEFASVINRKGMDGFLDELRAQVTVRGENVKN